MKERILTALIALPLLISFIYFANLAFFKGLLCVFSGLALHEFYKMALPPRRRVEGYLATIFGTIMTVGLLFSSSSTMMLATIVWPTIILMLVFLTRLQEMEQIGRELSIVVLGLVYVPLLISHAGMLRALPEGRNWIFLILLLVMVSDSVAYFTGRKWGQRRLYYAVSPNKSIEGALGGLIGAILSTLFAKVVFFNDLQTFDVFLLGVGIGLFSQLGDLFESMLKRSFGVKDSGSLIPGHGGMLDRLDSLLFAFPIAFYYAAWIF